MTAKELARAIIQDKSQAMPCCWHAQPQKASQGPVFHRNTHCSHLHSLHRLQALLHSPQLAAQAPGAECQSHSTFLVTSRHFTAIGSSTEYPVCISVGNMWFKVPVTEDILSFIMKIKWHIITTIDLLSFNLFLYKTKKYNQTMDISPNNALKHRYDTNSY